MVNNKILIMKTRIIVKAFFQDERGGKPVIVKVFDSVKDFKRKLELMPSYKELKEVNEMYNTERQKIVDELIERRNSELEKEYERVNKNRKDKIKFEKITRVPDNMMKELFEKLEPILDTEYKMKKALKFTQKEIEASQINMSEMLLIEEFMLNK